jgi:hypothetical protein
MPCSRGTVRDESLCSFYRAAFHVHRIQSATHYPVMNEDFRKHVDSLHPLFDRLMSMHATKVCSLPKSTPRRGIYLFSEGDRHLYVGRSNRLRVRLAEHCRRSSTHNSAPFAFLLARTASGKELPKSKTKLSRSQLEKHKDFHELFAAAKDRVSKMDVRFVEVIDPFQQALLEMYASIALVTPHNSFENH